MNNIKLTLITLTFLCFTASEAQVDYFQKFRPSKKWSVGLQISPTLTNSDADDAKIGLSGGAHVKYSISQSFGLKLSGNIGALKGGRLDHDFSGNRNNGTNGAITANQQTAEEFLGNAGNQAPSLDAYQFTNNYQDINLVGVFTLGNISFSRPLRKIQLFTFFGVGTIWSNVTGNFENPDDAAGATADARGYYTSWGPSYFTAVDANGNDLTPDAATADPSLIADAKSSYSGRNLTVPFGFGLKRNFGKMLDLGLEWRTNWTRSDNLDAFSFPIWRNRYSDFYSTLGLQASIKLGAKDEDGHYDWINPLETIYADMDSMKKITNDLKALTDDADGDGVGDFFDKENDTDCDRVYANGVAMDSDKDGINDCKDVEPFSICDDVDPNGKAKDDDNDGVINCLDLEPNSAKDQLVDNRGQKIEMPSVAGTGGSCCDCNNVTLPSLVFNNNSSRISPTDYSTLYVLAEKMKSCPGLNISATGYTTSKSGEQLAYKRVNAIVDHLEANYGIERSRITTGYSTGRGVEYSTRRIDLGQLGTY